MRLSCAGRDPGRPGSGRSGRGSRRGSAGAGDRAGQRRRSRGAALHLGHHRARQGRHAHPPQSRLECADAAWRRGASPRRDVLLHVLPIYHVHGLFVACNTALFAGARMSVLPRFDAAEVLEALPRATVMMGVPTYYTRLLAQRGLSRRELRRQSACSSRARRRCSSRPFASSRRAPASASSSATA